MSRKRFLKGLGAAVWALFTAAGIIGWMAERKNVEVLEQRVADLYKETQQAAIDKSVSEQMSTIASQQKDIAEERREEALKEKQRADRAFMRSEEERRKAELAGQEARREKEKAERERQRAVEARSVAEMAEREAKAERNKADSLHYQSLGRSLGAASRQAFAAGQQETAQLLAYYSVYFTERYGGAVFFPDVFQPLLRASRSMLSWGRHQGQVTAIALKPGSDDQLVSVCDYGCLLLHRFGTSHQKTDLKTDTLLSNPAYDFRHVSYGSNGTVLAVSRSGHFVAVSTHEKQAPRVISVLEKDHPFFFQLRGSDRVLVLGRHSMALVDLGQPDDKAVVETKNLDCQIIAHGQTGQTLLLFDDRHRQHLVWDMNHIEIQEVPVPGRVSTFASNDSVMAYGMENGSIYLRRQGRRDYQQLLGHESRITSLKLDHMKCYSSSYDGKVNFWFLRGNKTEPMELIDRQSWVRYMLLDRHAQYIWIGDKGGFLTRALLDVGKMKERIETELKRIHRDLTVDEWNYYIGSNTPYQPVICNNMKGGGR